MTAMGDVEMEGLVSSTPMKTRTEYEEEDDDESSYFQCTNRRWVLEAVVAAAVTLMLVRGVRNRHTASVLTERQLALISNQRPIFIDRH